MDAGGRVELRVERGELERPAAFRLARAGDDEPPDSGVTRALEDSSVARGNQDDLFFDRKPEAGPEPATDPLREELGKVNPDDLTPREALELLYRLKKL